MVIKAEALAPGPGAPLEGRQEARGAVADPRKLFGVDRLAVDHIGRQALGVQDQARHRPNLKLFSLSKVPAEVGGKVGDDVMKPPGARAATIDASHQNLAIRCARTGGRLSLGYRGAIAVHVPVLNRAAPQSTQFCGYSSGCRIMQKISCVDVVS